MAWYYIVGIILLISISLKFIINIYNLKRLQFLEKKYIQFIGGECGFGEYKHELIKFLKEADIKDVHIPYQEYAGYNQLLTCKLSIFDNIGCKKTQFAEYIAAMFAESEGVFKNRCIESFNPIYWIKFIINLPQHILNFIGISGESVINKIGKLIWWIFSVIYIIFKLMTL